MNERECWKGEWFGISENCLWRMTGKKWAIMGKVVIGLHGLF